MSPEPLASVAVAIWPAALTMALVAVGGRRRQRLRRRRLNACLHELRRPLQALVLEAPPRPSRSPDPLELALAALRDLDREVNGAPPELRTQAVDARALVIAAGERWRAAAARRGRAVRVRWRGAIAPAAADPVRVAQSLDNLIANALEHGNGPVTIEGAVRGGRVELAVRDGGPRSGARPGGGRRDARHGHGLRVTRTLAKRQGGSLRLRAARGGTLAVLELPVAAARDPRPR